MYMDETVNFGKRKREREREIVKQRDFNEQIVHITANGTFAIKPNEFGVKNSMALRDRCQR